MTPGEAHEVNGYDALMELYDRDPDRMLGDKGCDSDQTRGDLTDRGIEPVIPPRSNRKTVINYDREAYKRRNLIERCVNRLKQFRRIATRYEKTARAFLSMAMYRISKALAENCQQGLIGAPRQSVTGTERRITWPTSVRTFRRRSPPAGLTRVV